MSVGGRLVAVGFIVEDGSVVYAQLALVAPDVAFSVGYVTDRPQAHQLVGLYQGAPSAIQSCNSVGTPEVDPPVSELVDAGDDCVPVKKVICSPIFPVTMFAHPVIPGQEAVVVVVVAVASQPVTVE